MFILSDSRLYSGGSGGAFLDENDRFIGLAFKNLRTTLSGNKMSQVEHYRQSFALSAIHLKPLFYELSGLNKADTQELARLSHILEELKQPAQTRRLEELQQVFTTDLIPGFSPKL